jgi:hypothetical protein
MGPPLPSSSCRTRGSGRGADLLENGGAPPSGFASPHPLPLPWRLALAVPNRWHNLGPVASSRASHMRKKAIDWNPYNGQPVHRHVGSCRVRGRADSDGLMLRQDQVETGGAREAARYGTVRDTVVAYDARPAWRNRVSNGRCPRRFALSASSLIAPSTAASPRGCCRWARHKSSRRSGGGTDQLLRVFAGSSSHKVVLCCRLQYKPGPDIW